MQSTNNQEKLLDAMVLLEVADKMYPSVDHFFSEYSTSDLIKSAHDLIQYVYSDGEFEIEAETHELVATLEAARRYIDCGGHLWRLSVSGQEQKEHPHQASSFFQRIRARIGC
jgi:hypothetical protein